MYILVFTVCTFHFSCASIKDLDDLTIKWLHSSDITIIYSYGNHQDRITVPPIVSWLTFPIETQGSSETQNSRAVLPFFSMAFPGLLKPGMKITFTTNCLQQHLIVNVITVKQQYAPSVSFRY